MGPRRFARSGSSIFIVAVLLKNWLLTAWVDVGTLTYEHDLEFEKRINNIKLLAERFGESVDRPAGRKTA
ncbi:hypothetical protein A3D66_00045 [Candidatus Kaiserbacteria bacterium RIFCSPHIGHO2_02_FULL_50_9]|uniref:Uncharacterized protein n=1 Tax=Candidatus Kaiserbacteria bacterium RIFCSPLOWO2_01_FULL_51_21 TaxID=1798508 RepID=A0A1F6EEH6_9BACT|nr:MAG: hypothetical protein A2761_00270 [Candidatus Kaiserbacteria bacterium RIFCSPHIGHO2_01_FULL_51_33]OGG63705.1 MAG: hypothetical protein A3D66_00045 [Candidatus Kaiserbacteria bacterium RIFCSPHIGHO2_02_FULL_50_9]OGG72059.1 MAG: hypothetical protein A3A35_00905 [Candidatus Kaiserbacteria bacterium RIFCSPLOWO2_01_FULL_51_21]